MARHWMYHASHEARIFTTEELTKAEQEGWVDTPAKIVKAEEPKPAPKAKRKQGAA